MPTLPTVTVTDAQATRILDAYKAKYGTTTQAETVAAYKKELMEHVIQVVLQHEDEVLAHQQVLARQQQIEDLRVTLPDPNTVS